MVVVFPGEAAGKRVTLVVELDLQFFRPGRSSDQLNIVLVVKPVRLGCTLRSQTTG